MSNNPRCETCKHWHRFEASGSCDLIKTNDEWTELEPGQKAVISMESDHLSANLQTAPDFGCTLHEPKEDVA